MVHDYAYHEPTLVMATKGTMESEKFNLLFQKYDNNKTYLLPCVGLGELIENGNEEEVIKYLKTNIGRYKDITHFALNFILKIPIYAYEYSRL